MIEIREYLEDNGRSPFGDWFSSLKDMAAAKITVALERMAAGHTSAMKSVGGGVLEYKIDFGPGYRIYFGQDGTRLIVLVGGGTKKRQQRDIEMARAAWTHYLRRRD